MAVCFYTQPGDTYILRPRGGKETSLVATHSAVVALGNKALTFLNRCAWFQVDKELTECFAVVGLIFTGEANHYNHNIIISQKFNFIEHFPP